MNKTDFLNEAAKRSRLSEYHVNEVFLAAASIIAESLSLGNEVTIPGIGTFTTATRRRMTGKNLIHTGTKELPPCTYPVFKIHTSIKTRVKNAYKYENCLKS